MKIKLSNGYFIEVDNVCHTLKQTYIGENKEGEKKEYERFIGYFSNLEHALEHYVKHYQSDFMADASMDLDTYLRCVKDSNIMAVKQLKALLEENEE